MNLLEIIINKIKYRFHNKKIITHKRSEHLYIGDHYDDYILSVAFLLSNSNKVYIEIDTKYLSDRRHYAESISNPDIINKLTEYIYTVYNSCIECIQLTNNIYSYLRDKTNLNLSLQRYHIIMTKDSYCYRINVSNNTVSITTLSMDRRSYKNIVRKEGQRITFQVDDPKLLNKIKIALESK